MQNKDRRSPSVGLVGYGEVGKIFSAALVQQDVAMVIAYDCLLSEATAGEAMRQHAAQTGVRLAVSVAAMLAEVDLVISAVTADRTLTVAQEVALTISPGTYVIDVNSASPKTKSACAQLVDGAGGRYVEGAIMTSVPPYGIKAPMLLGGTHALDVAPQLKSLGFDVKVASEKLGVASAIKMCRSIIVKGMEAVTIESLTTARAYGVEQEVLASLAETFPAIDWEKQSGYFFERVVQHGKRRAEEMRESSATVRDIGIEPSMASAIADLQASVAALARLGVFSEPARSWRDRADGILEQRQETYK